MKIFVSACLLGDPCRYDGQSKEVQSLITWLKDKEYVAICPELPSLGVPRAPIAMRKDEKGYKLIQSETNLDVTEGIQNSSLAFMADHQDITIAILKSKSPSCGTGTTPLYDENNQFLGMGDGLMSAMMSLRGIKVYDENNFMEIEKEGGTTGRT